MVITLNKVESVCLAHTRSSPQVLSVLEVIGTSSHLATPSLCDFETGKNIIGTLLMNIIAAEFY